MILGYIIVFLLIPSAFLAAYISSKVNEYKRKRFLKQTHELFN